MKRIPLYLLFILLTQVATAQRCEQISMDHFGGNNIESIVPPGIITHTNGNFSIIVGTNSTNGNILTDCTPIGGEVFRRYDENYTTLLGQTCAPIGADFLGPTFYIFPQSNGDTILVGQSGLGNNDYGTERRDASGNVLWSKHYGGSNQDGLETVLQTADSGYLLVGASASDDGDVGLHYGTPYTADIWILKLDNDGSKLWSKVIGGTDQDVARAMTISADGDIYLFGYTASNDHDASGIHGGADLYIVKLDSLGNTLWHHCLGGSDIDAGHGKNTVHVIKDGYGGFYIGTFTGSQDGDVQQRMPDGADFWLLHIDSLANIIWENTFGGPGAEYPFAFCRAKDGSFWMGGYFLGGAATGGEIDVKYGGNDGWVVHADSMGHFINQIVLGADKAEYVNALHPLPDGTVLACGNYADYATPGSGSPGFPQTTEGGYDIFLAHLSPNTDAIADHSISSDAWELFPNPADKAVTIRIKKDEGKYTVHITDAAGRDIYKDRFRRQIIVDTSGWAPGIYIVQLTDKAGNMEIKRLTLIS